jgi:zinc and cadmium transporter
LASYCLLTLLASLAGGWIPLLVRLTHTRLQVANSFVAGMMLGIAILHLLPHAWEAFGSIDSAVHWLLAGFLVMFFIQRFFHFHHHDVPDEAPEHHHATSDTDDDHDQDHDQAGLHHGHAPRHASSPHAEHTLAQKSARQLSWGGAALGLGLHSLIDGVALASSVDAEARLPGTGWLVGLGTFLVVILHKPFDAMAVGTLMASGGGSRLARHWVNVLFALAIPVGVLLFQFGVTQAMELEHRYLGAALAFTAGSFLCIAASDLLPELQFHSHDRIKLSIALIAGLALSALIGGFETGGHGHGHEQGHEPAPPTAVQPAK